MCHRWSHSSVCSKSDYHILTPVSARRVDKRILIRVIFLQNRWVFFLFENNSAAHPLEKPKQRRCWQSIWMEKWPKLVAAIAFYPSKPSPLVRSALELTHTRQQVPKKLPASSHALVIRRLFAPRKSTSCVALIAILSRCLLVHQSDSAFLHFFTKAGINEDRMSLFLSILSLFWHPEHLHWDFVMAR